MRKPQYYLRAIPCSNYNSNSIRICFNSPSARIIIRFAHIIINGSAIVYHQNGVLHIIRRMPVYHHCESKCNLRLMIYTLTRDDIPLLSQWIKKEEVVNFFFFGGDGETCTRVLMRLKTSFSILSPLPFVDRFCLRTNSPIPQSLDSVPDPRRVRARFSA